MPDAMLPARLPPEKADPARFDAWLNLSQRENASVFIIVRISAMASSPSVFMHSKLRIGGRRCTAVGEGKGSAERRGER